MSGSTKFHLTGLAFILAAAPVYADDTSTGLLAGLGITVASGKTSLGDGAGGMEGGLLSEEALQQAGAIIATVANGAAASGDVIVVAGHADTLDLSLPEILKQNMNFASDAVERTCKTPPSGPAKAAMLEAQIKALTELSQNAVATGAEGSTKIPFLGKPTGKDLYGLAATDTSISALSLTGDDQVLMRAISMNSAQPTINYVAQLNVWNVWENSNSARNFSTEKEEERTVRLGRPIPVIGGKPATLAFRILGAPVAVKDGSAVWQSYKRLVDNTMRYRTNCTADPQKAVIAAADSLMAAVIASDKGPSLLTNALQIESLGTRPLLLRVRLDIYGATSVTHSGVPYALGLLSSAKVSAGLKAGFEIIDTATGILKRQGVVRCIVRQNPLNKTPDLLLHRRERRSKDQPYDAGTTVCDFRVAGTA